MSNSTFSGNSAGYKAAASSNSGTLMVSNSTFSGNSAYVAGGGGISNIGSGMATLKNTLVANSPAGGNCSGTITDGGGNLSYGDATCPGINGDPKLGPLQANGGPTQTMALGAGSAARDAAVDAICAAPPVNNLDQRGVARPQGAHCDIGAYEATPTHHLHGDQRGRRRHDRRHAARAAGECRLRHDRLQQQLHCQFEQHPGHADIDRDVTIDGAGTTVIISGGGAVGVFVVNPGVTLNLNKLTVADGKADYGGGIHNDGGTVTVSNSTFSGNSAD